jgi:hypothetical protein
MQSPHVRRRPGGVRSFRPGTPRSSTSGRKRLGLDRTASVCTARATGLGRSEVPAARGSPAAARACLPSRGKVEVARLSGAGLGPAPAARPAGPRVTPARTGRVMPPRCARRRPATLRFRAGLGRVGQRRVAELVEGEAADRLPEEFLGPPATVDAVQRPTHDLWLSSKTPVITRWPSSSHGTPTSKITTYHWSIRGRGRPVEADPARLHQPGELARGEVDELCCLVEVEPLLRPGCGHDDSSLRERGRSASDGRRRSPKRVSPGRKGCPRQDSNLRRTV